MIKDMFQSYMDTKLTDRSLLFASNRKPCQYKTIGM
jgi:hypothetical protein